MVLEKSVGRIVGIIDAFAWEVNMYASMLNFEDLDEMSS